MFFFSMLKFISIGWLDMQSQAGYTIQLVAILSAAIFCFVVDMHRKSISLLCNHAELFDPNSVN